ncbi:MAG: hypothetical protein GY696_27950 [Gammaproteobacteria bacterium]|nr:hypothetical protein [Gammaproteobacteria bacterium]
MTRKTDERCIYCSPNCNLLNQDFPEGWLLKHTQQRISSTTSLLTTGNWEAAGTKTLHCTVRHQSEVLDQPDPLEASRTRTKDLNSVTQELELLYFQSRQI